MMKQKYKYSVGKPSWHQVQAHHTSAGTLIVEHTPEEHASFVARYKERGEPCSWVIIYDSRKEALQALDENALRCVLWMENGVEMSAVNRNGARRVQPSNKPIN